MVWVWFRKGLVGFRYILDRAPIGLRYGLDSVDVRFGSCLRDVYIGFRESLF